MHYNENAVYGIYMPNNLKRKPRHLIEALSTFFLSLFQYTPVAGPWYGLMVFPLAFYVFDFFWSLPEFREQQLHIFLFEPKLMFGRIIALIGFSIFIAAFIQMLKAHRKGLLTGGLYSVVRHPQYFGIIILTLGLTIMSIQWSGWNTNIASAWLIEVFGYILLANYEERCLLREYGKEYIEYRRKVPFIFPIRLSKTPDPLVAILIALITILLLTFI
jgi:protein-S-isoprenylcysteine O-methyltransferase Ste14